MEGERKSVTVMFADVSGFTAMSERLDPEEVHAIMDRAFEVILDAVHRYEGTINQFLGDGVMALFGAPIAHEDHPHRALCASLAIQEGLQPLREEVHRAHGVEFRIRIGINTGFVVVGAIGKDLRMDYTAVGDTTNLAARLLSLAKPGQIVISRRTQHLRDGFFVFEDLGEFQVKGKTEPVRAYALISEIRGRTRLEVSKERGLTPLAGRERELRLLTEAYRRAEGGAGAIVMVAGDPGAGKSRLLYEFLRGLEGFEGLELEATCQSHGRAMAYHPILELLRRYLGLSDGMTAEEIRARVFERLQSLGLDGEEDRVLTAHFLGLSASPDFLTRLGPQLKERTFRVLREVFLRASGTAPVILIVENLHWTDASSEEFLKHLTESLPGHRILLVLSTRLGFSAPWLTAPLAETITLEGLESEHVRGMVRALLGAEGVSLKLLRILLEKGEGNPLYVEEILRQLQESGRIEVEEGRARLRGSQVNVPGTIHDIIAARIDRLAEPLKHTLQVAAVVGRQFALPLLSRVVETNGALLDHLRALQALEFVFLSAEEPERVYVFKHALTQDVAYTGLLERRRRLYHAAVGLGIEELYAGRTDEVVELLAFHFGRSAEAEKAVDYAILAAEKAQRRWANAEALAYFEDALRRLSTMPDTEPNRLRRIDAVLKQAEVKFALGQHVEHIQALEAIRDVVEATADPPRRAAWSYWTGFLHSVAGGRPEVPIGYCREAAAIADAHGLDEIKALAECGLTHVYGMAGELRAALEAGERGVAMFEERGNVWWACRTLWGLSIAAIYTGEWGRSLEYCRRALEHGRSVNDVRLKVVGLWRTGWTHIQRGDPKTGLPYCEEALSLSPSPFDAAMARAAHGYGLVKAGQAAAGIAELGEAVAWFGKSNLGRTRVAFAVWLGDAYLRQGEREKARASCEEVLAISRDLGYRNLEGMAHRLLGESWAADDPSVASQHLEAATQILEEVGARNELAKALAARAELLRGAGNLAGERELLERALKIFEELGTLDEQPRVRAALAALPSP
jgi:class 3 adenylate cyclase/tetratricopeptide (TPR) repeat protein